jgi:hypothetical protein
MNESEIKKTIEKFCLGDSSNLFVQKLRDGGLSDEHIAVVINAIKDTCNDCWDSEKGCQCWNDS